MRPDKLKAILDRMDVVPPFMVRVMAINTGRGKNVTRMQSKEIVEKSGLVRRSVERISYLTSWDSLRVGVASKFCQACGVDIFCRQQLYEFTRTHVKRGLKFLTPQQYKRFSQLCVRLKAEQKFKKIQDAKKSA